MERDRAPKHKARENKQLCFSGSDECWVWVETFVVVVLRKKSTIGQIRQLKGYAI